ncbi:hydroxyisourate hydrolase [Gryllotalpicola protaetiae]|uniref:5-hydroxyisourate hydrolase n=1 Tax=Gryllotalpicola protaetiae TaxID=2419771 RepID=A0A387BN76_9MICO|nr:hydroxyisourate hydrolase [Gryllotalpicola protaetiae]
MPVDRGGFCRVNGDAAASVSEPDDGHLSVHVLDTVTGGPAPRLAVALESRSDAGWRPLGRQLTDEDGRIDRLGPEAVSAGCYRLMLDTAAFFASRRSSSFFPEVVIAFKVFSPGENVHLAVLLGPFAYTAYRGS